MTTAPTPRLTRRGLLAVGALAALLGLAVTPAAWAWSGLVRVEVLDRDAGSVLHVWRDHGGRPVVAGRPGARYAVRLVNLSGQRVLAVVAIDGVNVVTGETAAVGQRGYVLDPWQRTEITGWRKSNDEVAAFEFTSLSDSYAARTGRPLDVGVIGVAVFREAQRLPVSEVGPDVLQRPQPSGAFGARSAEVAPPAGPGLPPPAPSSDMARSAPPAADRGAESRGVESRGDAGAPPRPAERLGTGHGERETSVVRITSFERASSVPDQRVEIRYDSEENLAAAGIVPPPRVAGSSANAFPADPGYVPDPPRR